jgi:hypothetical protein
MIKLRYLSNVRLNLLAPQIVLAIMTALPVYEEAGATELWVTSCNDSEHSPTSLHYLGRAVDLRTKNLPRNMRTQVAATLGARLESAMGFTVLFEDPDGSNEHLHIQYREAR